MTQETDDDACAIPPEPGTGSAGLTLVATPIGNLGDLSPRARDALAGADVVLCEDSRVTLRLLSANGIARPLWQLHEHNEDTATIRVLAALREGKRMVLVADAGTPLVSDPGYRLVRAAIAAGLSVTAIPGPVASVVALTLSGLPPMPFLMLGFPPAKQTARKNAFGALRAAEVAGLSATLIWYEAPHRLAETLEDLLQMFGPRPAAVARELTKRFEEVRRGSLAELAAHYASAEARGEITVIVAPPGTGEVDDLDSRIREALTQHSVRDAAALVAAASGRPRKEVYARVLELTRGMEI